MIPTLVYKRTVTRRCNGMSNVIIHDALCNYTLVRSENVFNMRFRLSLQNKATIRVRWVDVRFAKSATMPYWNPQWRRSMDTRSWVPTSSDDPFQKYFEELEKFYSESLDAGTNPLKYWTNPLTRNCCDPPRTSKKEIKNLLGLMSNFEWVS